MPDFTMDPGDLREKLQFQSRQTVDDGYGGPGAGDWTLQFAVYANLKPLRGTEAVMQSRLQGRQPYIATVRQSTNTRRVDTNWRVVDDRDPTRIFGISAPPTDPDGKRAWLEILITEGGPN